MNPKNPLLDHFQNLVAGAKQNPMAMLDARNRAAVFDALVRVVAQQDARLDALEARLKGKDDDQTDKR